MIRRSLPSIVFGRTLVALPTLFGAIVITFVLTRTLPGDPAAYFAGGSDTSYAAIEAMRRKLGLDKSLPEQFLIYLGDLFRGDLGQSLTTGQRVLSDLIERLPASLELTIVAFVMAAAVSLPLGILAATRPGSWIDGVCRLVTTAGVSLPTFFTGLLLIYVFYYLLGWAPSPVGRLDPFMVAPPTVTGFLLIDSLVTGHPSAFLAALGKLLLPASTMAIFTLAPLARMTRAAMLGVLSADFVRTARALGLPPRQVLYTYALRNALLPITTTLGMVFSYMLGANVLVEKVFSWPGIGSYALNALVANDYAPVQGFVLMMAVVFVLINLVVDVLYTVIDPRIALEG
jgi:peptide/nickel transport system permease protein